MHSLRFAAISALILTVLAACQSTLPPTPQEMITPVIRENPTAAAPVNRDTNPDVLSACPVSEQQGAMRSGQVPEWQHLGIFACYQLSLTIDDPAAPYHGTEILTFNNITGTTLGDIVLRTFPNSHNIYGGNMTIASVQVNEKSVSFEDLLSDHSAIRIALPQPLNNGSSVQLKVDFTLSPPLDFQSKDAYGIFNRSSDGNEITLADWYPILSTWKDDQWQFSPVLLEGDAVTSDTALYQVTVNVPGNWKVAATGKQIQSGIQNNVVQYRFVSGPVRDFILVTGPNLASRQDTVDDIVVTQWGEPSTIDGWDQGLAFAKAALAYYDRTFGAYPYNELDLVAVPMQDASGDEFPGLVLILDTEYKSLSQRDFLNVVIAHEIAHQWWYSLVGDDVLNNPWQDEAMATYSSMLYLQSINSPIFTSLLNQYKNQVSSFDRSHPNQPITQPVSAFQGRGGDYSTVVYKKGALFLDAVRNQIGDLAFFRAIKSYYQQNQYRLIEPQPLLDAFSSSCQCNLSQVEQVFGVAVSP
jgi:aminopeptidase N